VDSKKTDMLINSLMNDTMDEIPMSDHEIKDTIQTLMKDYNLQTDLTFVEKMHKMHFPTKGETLALDDLPKQLTDSAFLPTNHIADIALRQDIDMVVSQIPELFSSLQITRDAVCEADIADGTIARDIKFNNVPFSAEMQSTTLETIKQVEHRLDLHSMVKNHLVLDTLRYGEGYFYVIPYGKVFHDLYKYRVKDGKDKSKNPFNMFDQSSLLNGYGYGESAVEVSLMDSIQGKNTQNTTKQSIFTEAEIIDIDPHYHKDQSGSELHVRNAQKNFNESVDKYLDEVASRISFISKDIAIPVIEETGYALGEAYKRKYMGKTEFVQESGIFNTAMEGDNFDFGINAHATTGEGMASIFLEAKDKLDEAGMEEVFSRVKGVYVRVLPATKLIPIRIDREVIGYYYISDLTRPEESGQRKNSGMAGYSMRTPSAGFDTFSPDLQFCQKLAMKIIDNFDIPFMKENKILHKQIVSILQAHKFNEALMRFIFIPAEHVVQCTINKDGIGKGHSMLEPGLITARMYMFLKMYSLLYQINNSEVRVYNLRQSGIDKNYDQNVAKLVRKFSTRRITHNDIFDIRGSMGKISGGSELVMPVGPDDKAPFTVDKIDAASAPIDNDLLETLKIETINASSVPSMMVMNNLSEIEFAREIKEAHALFDSMCKSYKIDFDRDITLLYRKIIRWETEIDPDHIKDMTYRLIMTKKETLSVTTDMISNFNTVKEIVVQTWLSHEEQTPDNKDAEESETVQELTKLLIAEWLPGIDCERMVKLCQDARLRVQEAKAEKQGSNKTNLIDIANESRKADTEAAAEGEVIT
jgi:hypothetical protein